MNITNNKKLKTLAIIASATILVFNLIFGIVLGIKVFGKNSNFVSVADQQVEIVWDYKYLYSDLTGKEDVLNIYGTIKDLSDNYASYIVIVFSYYNPLNGDGTNNKNYWTISQYYTIEDPDYLFPFSTQLPGSFMFPELMVIEFASVSVFREVI